MRKLVIIGAGLAGCVLGLFMARRGYSVLMFESREDIRVAGGDNGRSINLALSCRGITALKALDLYSEVEKITVPMRARAIHTENGQIKYQAFGRHHEEYINAIQRTTLNQLLLNQISKAPNIELNFNSNITNIDLLHKTINIEGELEPLSYDILIGADGAHSIVREALVEQAESHASRDFFEMGYKELTISRTHGTEFIKEHLHLWPRGHHSLLGNPNSDDSITGSLFLPMTGEDSFDSLKTDNQIIKFFKTSYPDAFNVMPNLIEEFRIHPVGRMSTVKCDKWFYQDSCLILGDAAHGLIPFFGQGMNSAFEDCRILDELLTKYQDNWSKTIPDFFETRKPNADAVAQMSMDNYTEIQENIRNPEFNLKKNLEMELMHRFPNLYISKHIFVMFTNVDYAKAYRLGQMQNEILKEIIDNKHEMREINWVDAEKTLMKYVKKMTNTVSFEEYGHYS